MFYESIISVNIFRVSVNNQRMILEDLNVFRDPDSDIWDVHLLITKPRLVLFYKRKLVVYTFEVSQIVGMVSKVLRFSNIRISDTAVLHSSTLLEKKIRCRTWRAPHK